MSQIIIAFGLALGVSLGWWIMDKIIKGGEAKRLAREEGARDVTPRDRV